MNIKTKTYSKEVVDEILNICTRGQEDNEVWVAKSRLREIESILSKEGYVPPVNSYIIGIE